MSLRMVFGRCRDVDTFKKLNRVGEGTYGIVYRAQDRITGDVVALKKIRMEHENNGMPLSSLREIAILKGLKHENVVKVLDVVVSRELNGIFLVMEYCAQDLATLLDNKKTPFSVSEVKCLLLQLLRGVQYCHANFIIHRDLKLSNLLLTDKGILKIADFGLARHFGYPPRPMTPKVVTLWYRPPEVLLGSKAYTIALDVWSVGCIFGELLNHAPLLPGKTEIGQLEMIFDLLGTPNEQIWPGLRDFVDVNLAAFPHQPYNNVKAKFPTATAATVDLLNKFLMYDPQRRILLSDALKHPYFEEAPIAQDPSFMPSFVEFRNEPSNVTRERRDASNERYQPKDDSMFSRESLAAHFGSGSHFNTGSSATTAPDAAAAAAGGAAASGGKSSAGGGGAFSVEDALRAVKRRKQLESQSLKLHQVAKSTGNQGKKQ